MSAFVRRSKALLAGLALVLGLSAPAGAEPPRRVVSINLCTDQLALLIAAPGQLVSVSNLGQDAMLSAMADRAAAFPANRGQAEEVFLMRPDLVLAGTFTTQSTVDLLQRLGVPVAQFPPVSSLDDLRDGIVRMGAALGREAVADEIVARFDADLAAISATAPVGTARPRAALYYPNGYSLGDRTLAGQVLAAAGLANVAAEAGLHHGGHLALEQLVLADPDLILTGRRYPTPARAQDVLDHPALTAGSGAARRGNIDDRDLICGTPQVLKALADLVARRQALAAPAPAPEVEAGG